MMCWLVGRTAAYFCVRYCYDGNEIGKEEITRVLINLGFINELEWITSKTYKQSGLYIFSSYLEDIAKNIDKYINIKGAI